VITGQGPLPRARLRWLFSGQAMKLADQAEGATSGTPEVTVS
jgi:hypothetical protein